MTLTLTTSAFASGGTIPAEFTCDGLNVSPALEWSGAPAATESFALIVDDPDAPSGNVVHWPIYVPSANSALEEGIPTAATLPSGARQGTNDFRKVGYGGPCPPPGPAHRYYFRLYALNKRLDLPSGATRAAVDRAMRGHILSNAELMGRYRRP